MFNGLRAGTYTVYIKDANECLASLDYPVTIINYNDSPRPEADAYLIDENSIDNYLPVLINDDIGCDNWGESSIDILIPPLHGFVRVNNNNTPSDPSDDYVLYTPSHNYYLNDSFTYTIKDADGDQGVALASIQVAASPLHIPEGFSPNADGRNDKFYIRGLYNYPLNSIVIFDKNGFIVFEDGPYLNNWDGKNWFNGNDDLPQDTYFYLFDKGDGSAKIKGFVYLNRK